MTDVERRIRTRFQDPEPVLAVFRKHYMLNDDIFLFATNADLEQMGLSGHDADIVLLDNVEWIKTTSGQKRRTPKDCGSKPADGGGSPEKRRADGDSAGAALAAAGCSGSR